MDGGNDGGGNAGGGGGGAMHVVMVPSEFVSGVDNVHTLEGASA